MYSEFNFKLFSMQPFEKIVLATNNQGKVSELRALLEPLGIEILSQSDFEIESIEETGRSFVENAILKARHVSDVTGLAALADDSGLCVDALQGAPGIHSARFAGVGATDSDNNQKLLMELKDVSDAQRGAHFRCVLALVKDANDPVPVICEGEWHGKILHQTQGNNGFGYDPLFFVTELQKVSAELSPAVKNQHSHRARALKDLLARINQV